MWIKTDAMFMPVDMEDSEWENLSQDQKWERYKVAPFRFRQEELCAYNETSEGITTVWLKSGDTWMINKTVQELDKILGI